MALYTDSLLVYSSGKLTKIAPTDSLAITGGFALGGALKLGPYSSPISISAVAGGLIYDSTANEPLWSDGSSWRTFGSLSASTLQDAYDGGPSITLTDGNTLDVNVPLSGVAGITFDSKGVRSNFTVTNERLDLKSVGSFATGTQVLIEATNSAGASQVVIQADSNVLMQTPTASPTLYFLADSDAPTPFIAIEADNNSAGIYIGSEPFNSFVAIGTDGARIIDVGNTNTGTEVNLHAQAGVTVEGTLTGDSYVRPGVSTFTPAAPTGAQGALIYDSTANQPKWHDGAVWQTFGSLANPTTLQGAYNASSTPATITLSNGKNLVVDVPVSGTAGFSLNAFGAPSQLSVGDSTLTLNSTRTSTGGHIDMTAGGAMNIATDGLGQMTFSTAAAKIVMTADYNSASTGEIRIRSQNSGAGGAEFTAKAKTYVRVGAGSVTEPNYDITFDSVTKAVNLQAKENASFINIGTSAYDTTVQLGQYLVKLLSQMQLAGYPTSTLSSLPPFVGALAFDTDENKPKWYDGAVWQNFVGAPPSPTSLQGAYDAGQTISLSSAKGDLVVSVGTGTVAVAIDTNKPSHFKTTNAALSLQTLTSGTLDVTSAGALDFDAVGAVSVNSSTGAVNVGDDPVNGTVRVATGGTRTFLVGSRTSPVVLNTAYNGAQNGAPVGYQLKSAGTSQFNVGHVVRYDSSGVLAKTDITLTGGAREVVGIALESDTTTVTRVATMYGSVAETVFDSAPSGTDTGKPVYISSTAGVASLTPPSATGSRVFRIGVLADTAVGPTGGYFVVFEPHIVADL